MNNPKLDSIDELFIDERADYLFILDDKLRISMVSPDLTKALSTLVASIIGEDEKHSNGQKMVNDPSVCMDCTNPDERYCRNRLRAEQRLRAKEAGL